MGCTRFLLALCVVVAHTQGSKIFDFAPMSAVTAVQAFYVISGFLITMVLNEHSEYTSLRRFYLSRYLRLWPCYAAIAALTLIFFMPLISTSLWTLDIKAASLVLFSNLTLFLQDWTLFFELHNGHLVPTANFGAGPQPWLTAFLVVPQAWTLGVELVFYVIAPFFCRRWYTMLALFLGGFAVRLAIGMWHPPAMDPWLYRFAPAEMMLFGAGGLSYFIGRTLLNLLPAWATSTAAVLCGVAIISLTLANEYTTPLVQARFGWFAPSLWLTNAPILLFIAVACPILFSATKQNAIDRFIGELSYPMYISHVFVLTFLVRHVPILIQRSNVLSTVTVVLFSAGLYFTVIQPFDRLRRRVRFTPAGRSAGQSADYGMRDSSSFPLAQGTTGG